MYVCVYIHMHVHVYIYTYTCTCTRTCESEVQAAQYVSCGTTCLYEYVRVCAYVSTFVHVVETLVGLQSMVHVHCNLSRLTKAMCAQQGAARPLCAKVLRSLFATTASLLVQLMCCTRAGAPTYVQVLSNRLSANKQAIAPEVPIER